MVFNHLKQNNLMQQYFVGDYSRNWPLLKNNLQIQVRQFDYLLAGHELQRRVAEWFPHIYDETRRKIVNFLSTKYSRPETLANFASRKENFLSNFRPHANEFNRIHQSAVVKELKHHVWSFLKQKYPDNSDVANEEFYRFIGSNIEYSIETLLDVRKLAKITNSLDRPEPSFERITTTTQRTEPPAIDEFSWIYMNLEQVLRTRYSYDQSRVDHVMQHLTTNKLDQNQLRTMTRYNVRSKLLLFIEEYEKDLAIDACKTKLSQMFPALTASIINLISEFWKGESIPANNITEVCSSKLEFYRTFDIKNFASRNSRHIQSAIDEQARVLISNKLGLDSAEVAKVFKTFQDSKPHSPWLLFDESKIIQIVRLNELRGALKIWYPNDIAFNDIFVEYLKTKNIPTATLTQLSRNKTTFLKNVYFEDYARDHRRAYVDRVFEKIEIFLNHKFDPSEVHRIINDFRIREFDNKFSPEMLYNFRSITEIVNTELNFEAECLERVNLRKEKYPSLNNNNCIADEICRQRKGYQDGFLDKEIQKYLPRKLFLDRKIKDEIDETIYDIVLQTLQAKKNLKKPECIADYIKRNDKMDTFYDPELFFNEEKLWALVQPMINEYNRQR